ncbi:hypothetical protein NECAME_07664 [Necator americanus]|uniref:Uncharacterized protein n=1 Tax=Necator americanus TaxID=51031 RepID=W2TLH5_NECAM|nr:hypothetical protein NECAME_07664 [Necator americanus]ETN82950.1 hypothetical protein NECAME_07664 [Necator americanus]
MDATAALITAVAAASESVTVSAVWEPRGSREEQFLMTFYLQDDFPGSLQSSASGPSAPER